VRKIFFSVKNSNKRRASPGKQEPHLSALWNLMQQVQQPLQQSRGDKLWQIKHSKLAQSDAYYKYMESFPSEVRVEAMSYG
jgi:hypothetical protein